jgi:hypothetical protein
MGKEHKYGLMVLNMKVCGKIIKHVVKEHSTMLMVMYFKGNGKMIKQMATESILI